ncbi:MAG TPA: PIN domain-containing protein [Terriglobia bacterium]|nr:PIN domain-containing protein [Terriglobia bacterium]
MICADTSSFIAYTRGEAQTDVAAIAQALSHRLLVLAPASVTELLSDPRLSKVWESLITELPGLEILPGYWVRAGKLRASLFQSNYRPKVADTLIAQSCLDHDVPLITRDRDFEGFAKVAGLRLL